MIEHENTPGVKQSPEASKKKLRNKIDLGPTPQIMALLQQRTGQSREEWGRNIDEELVVIYRWLLPKPQLSGVPPEQILDDLIIRQAENLGWRIFSSETVLRQLSTWDELDEGPEHHERLGEALATSVRIVQKKEPPRGDDPLLSLAKKETVRELRPLLASLRAKFSAKHREPSPGEAIRAFGEEVRANGGAYAHLHACLEHWTLFLQQDPSWVTAFGKRTSPATMFDSWIAWCKGGDQEHWRQQMSRHKPLSKL